MRQRLLVTVLAVLGVILAFIVRRWSRQRIAYFAEQVGRYRTDAFNYTLYTAFMTALVALPFPLLGGVICLFILQGVPAENPAGVLATGFAQRLLLWYALSCFFFVCMPRGLADTHFRWSAATISAMKRAVWLLIVTLVPLAAVYESLDIVGSEPLSATIGRVLFTVAMLAVAVILFRLLRFSGPLFTEYIRRMGEGWIMRLRYVWMALVVLTPITLIVGSWLGYAYTAIQLSGRVEQSIVLVVIVGLLNALMLRWLFIARRRVAVEDARRRREQAEADRAGGSDDPDAPKPPLPSVEEDRLNLPAVSAQMRQLISTAIVMATLIGLFVIWADVMPALRVFDRVQLYPSITYLEDSGAASAVVYASAGATTNGSSGDAALLPSPADPSGLLMPGTGGAEIDTSVTTDGNITLADLGLAVIILALTVISFRNVPGLIDIVVLQRLPLDTGSRYALSTVIRYMHRDHRVWSRVQFAVDMSWSNIQWLAAALTFGLAFGLQEIFANFVSGLIILAERPIRIGDTVTIGSLSGTVTRIKHASHNDHRLGAQGTRDSQQDRSSRRT
jgi:potassium efflux system protein